jgi:hypothetical protein
MIGVLLALLVSAAPAPTTSDLCPAWYATPPNTDAACVVDGVSIYLPAAPAPTCELVRKRPIEGASTESMVVALHELASRTKEKGADTVHLVQYDKRSRGDAGPKWTARGQAFRCSTEVKGGECK